MSRTEHAHALAERIHAAEARLEQIAEAGGTPVLVSPARYPAASRPYTNAFSAVAPADPADGSRASDSPSSSGGAASPVAAESFHTAAADALAGTSGALADATAGLRRLAADVAAASAAAAATGNAAGVDAARVPGRDTVELFHFFNQAPPLEPQLRQEVSVIQNCTLSCRLACVWSTVVSRGARCSSIV